MKSHRRHTTAAAIMQRISRFLEQVLCRGGLAYGCPGAGIPPPAISAAMPDDDAENSGTTIGFS